MILRYFEVSPTLSKRHLLAGYIYLILFVITMINARYLNASL